MRHSRRPIFVLIAGFGDMALRRNKRSRAADGSAPAVEGLEGCDSTPEEISDIVIS